MRIAQVAPLYESVPPQFYKGTERVISYLTEQSVKSGHDVALFASGDSETSARLVPGCDRALWHDPYCRETVPHHIRLMDLVFRQAEDFDIISFPLRLSTLAVPAQLSNSHSDHSAWQTASSPQPGINDLLLALIPPAGNFRCESMNVADANHDGPSQPTRPVMRMDPNPLAVWQAIMPSTCQPVQNPAQSSFWTLRSASSCGLGRPMGSVLLFVELVMDKTHPTTDHLRDSASLIERI